MGNDIEMERRILEQAREMDTYVNRRIVRDPDNSKNYLVFQLLRSGKYYNTLASLDSEGLLRSLQSLEKRKSDGKYSSFMIKVDGKLLDGESRCFVDVGELVEALKLEQGAEVAV